MGFTSFSSYDNILEYNYKSRGEIIDALGALKAMFEAKNITKYQYENAVKLLNSKLNCF